MPSFTDDFLDKVESSSTQDVEGLYNDIGPERARELKQAIADRRMNRGPSISAATPRGSELLDIAREEELSAIQPLDLEPKQYPSFLERVQQEQIVAEGRSLPRQIAGQVLPAVGLLDNPVVSAAAKAVLEPVSDVLQSGVGRPAVEEAGRQLVKNVPAVSEYFPQGGAERHGIKALVSPYAGKEYLAEDAAGRQATESLMGPGGASLFEGGMATAGALPLYEVAGVPIAGAAPIRAAGRAAGEAVAPIGQAVAQSTAQAQGPLGKLMFYLGYASPTVTQGAVESGLAGAALMAGEAATKREGDIGKAAVVGGVGGGVLGGAAGGVAAAKTLRPPKKPVTIFSPKETQALHDQLVASHEATQGTLPGRGPAAPPQLESGLPPNFKPGFATVDVASNGVPKIVLSEVGPGGIRQAEVSYSSSSAMFDLLDTHGVSKSLQMSSRFVQAADQDPGLATIRDTVFKQLYSRYESSHPAPPPEPLIRNTDKESTKSLLKNKQADVAFRLDETKTLPKITSTPPLTVVDPDWAHPATGGHTMIVDTGDGLGTTFVRTPDNRNHTHLPDVGDITQALDGEVTVVIERGPDSMRVMSVDGTSTRQVRAGDLTLVNTNDIPLLSEALSGAGNLAQFPKITPELVQGIYRSDPLSAHDLLMTMEHEGYIKKHGDAYVPTQRLAKLNTAHDAVTQVQKPVAVGAMRANELDAPTLDATDVPISKGDEVRVRSSGARGKVVGEDPASPGNVLVKISGKVESMGGQDIKVLGSGARKKRAAPLQVVTIPRDRAGSPLAVNDGVWIRPSRNPLTPMQGIVRDFRTRDGRVYANIEVGAKRITPAGDFVPAHFIRYPVERLQKIPVVGEKIEGPSVPPAILARDINGLANAYNLIEAVAKLPAIQKVADIAEALKKIVLPKQQWGDDALNSVVLKAYGAQSVLVKEHDIAHQLQRGMPDKKLSGQVAQDLTKWGAGKMTEEEFFAKHPQLASGVKQRLQHYANLREARQEQLEALEMMPRRSKKNPNYGQEELAYLHRDYLAHSLEGKEYAKAVKEGKLPFDLWGKYETAVRFVREHELQRTGRITSEHDARNMIDEILGLAGDELQFENAIKAGRFGFLRHRQKLPDAIMDLLDPNVGGVVRWTRTFIQQEFAYQWGKAMASIRKNPEWWSIGATDVHTYNVPNERKYGMARGGWVPQEVGEALFTPMWNGPAVDSPAAKMVLDIMDKTRGIRSGNLTIGQGPRFMILNFFRNYVPAVMSSHFDPFSRKTVTYFVEAMHDLATWSSNPDPFSGNIMWELSQMGVSLMGQAQMDAKVIQKTLTSELIDEVRAASGNNLFSAYHALSLASNKIANFARFWADSGDSVWKIMVYREAKDWALTRGMSMPNAQSYAARVVDESFVNFEHPSRVSNAVRKTPGVNAALLFFTARFESTRNRGMQMLQLAKSPFVGDGYRAFRVMRGMAPLMGLAAAAVGIPLLRGVKLEDIQQAYRMRTRQEKSMYPAAGIAPWSGYDESGNFKADFFDLTSGIEEAQLLRGNETLNPGLLLLANTADAISVGDGSVTAQISDLMNQVDPTISPGYRPMQGLPPAGEKGAAYILFNGLYRNGAVPRAIPMSMDIIKKSGMFGNKLPITQEQWGPAATAAGLTTGLMREPVTAAPDSPTDIANALNLRANVAKNRGTISREKHEYRKGTVEAEDAVEAAINAKKSQEAAVKRYMESQPPKTSKQNRRKQ